MRSIFALVLPLALLAGCASSPPADPPPEAPAEESSPASTSPADTQDGGLFEKELSVTVDGGRTLTLVAHCKETAMEGFSTYGTGTIDVLDGEEPVSYTHLAGMDLTGGKAKLLFSVHDKSFLSNSARAVSFSGGAIVFAFIFPTSNGQKAARCQWERELRESCFDQRFCGNVDQKSPFARHFFTNF